MDDFDFSAAVLQAFRFLREQFGFKCALHEPSAVGFESSSMFLNVVFDRHRSYEVTVEVGPLGQGPASDIVGYSLGEVLRFFGAPEAQKYAFIQSTDPTEISRLVSVIASLLRDRASRLLAGSSDALRGLAAQRRRETRQYAAEEELRRARALAMRAWRERRYGDYVTLLAPLVCSLKESERKKLVYAQRHVRQGGR